MATCRELSLCPVVHTSMRSASIIRLRVRWETLQFNDGGVFDLSHPPRISHLVHAAGRNPVVLMSIWATSRALALAVSVTLIASGDAFGQDQRCIGDALDSDAPSEGRWQPCAKTRSAVQDRAARSFDDERNPSAPPRVMTPPGAIMKKVLPPDSAREERALRENVHRALRKQDRGKLIMTPECQAIVRQIAEQQPMLRSLRSETRTQARDRVGMLTGQFRELACQDAK